MDETFPRDGDPSLEAQADEAGSLRLTPLPPVTQPAFALTHPYFEFVYAPTLGPAAVLVARRLGRVLVNRGAPIAVSAVALSLELGLRASHNEPLGKNSSLRHALDRLAHERIIKWFDEHHIGVHTAVPVVSKQVRDRLPPNIRDIHDGLVGAFELRCNSRK